MGEGCFTGVNRQGEIGSGVLFQRRCVKCDPEDARDFDKRRGVWKSACKHATQQDCEKACQDSWLWFGSRYEVRGQQAAGCVGRPLSSSASSADSSEVGDLRGSGYGFRAAGGLAAKCACDMGYGWRKVGDHQCGCDDVEMEEPQSAACGAGSGSRFGPDAAWALQRQAASAADPRSGVGVSRHFRTGGFAAYSGGAYNYDGLVEGSERRLHSAAAAGPCAVGGCGKDITERLDELYDSIKAYLVTPGRLASICSGSLDMTIVPGAHYWSNAWDVCELAWQWGVFSGLKCGQGACSKTVTVDGRCYRTDDVNYWLWGVLLGICSRPMPVLAYRMWGLLPVGDVDSVGQYLSHPLVVALGNLDVYRAVSTLGGLAGRSGRSGRRCWLLRGWARTSPSPYNIDPDPWCADAASEFADCGPCDAKYMGKLHARLKGVVNGVVTVHNVSTSGVVRFEPPDYWLGLSYLGVQVPKASSCGRH